MAGIASVGWYVPSERRDVREMAQDYGVSEAALRKLLVESHAVAGPEDHPSPMGAKATRNALDALGLGIDDVDLLMFVSMTRDRPSPWVAAYGVLNLLGGKRPAGMDLSNRCAASHDALWWASKLVDAGAYRRIVVCCADRFDYLMGPPRPAQQPTDATFSAGAAAVVVTADGPARILAFRSLTNDDLSQNQELGPYAGGSLMPASTASVLDGLHRWQNRMSLQHTIGLRRYMAEADRHNVGGVCAEVGFEEVDFIACSPLDIPGQLANLAELGIGPDRAHFTLPVVGHIGPADTLLGLGTAIASGRWASATRVVMSTRTAMYSNALAIRAAGGLGAVAVRGDAI